MLLPSLRTKYLHHGDLVAGLELGAAQAILPGFQREFAAFYFMKACLGEESFHIGEREDGVQSVELRFRNQRIHHQASDAVLLVGLGYGERADFTHGWR